MIDKIYRFVVAIVLAGLGGAAILAILRFLLDIGPLWTAMTIFAGVVIWRQLQASEN